MSTPTNEPIHFNEIVYGIEEDPRVARMLKSGSPFDLCFGHQHVDGKKYYTAYLKLGGVWKFTRNLHLTPTDALRELTETINAKL